MVKKLLLLAGTLLALAGPAAAQPVMGPDFAADYTLTSLGSITDLPGPYGGLTFLAGDPNTLLIGGNANNALGAIYTVAVTRDIDGHIIGLGAAQFHATAPNIDGGLSYGPGGVLFATTFANNNLLQYLPGAAAPTKTINLGGFGIASSVGTLGFAPAGYPGAGTFYIMSYNSGDVYSADLVADGGGTYDLANVTQLTDLNSGPEGIVWVPLGSTAFGGPSQLVSEYGLNEVGAYELDANGVAIPGTRRIFVDGLTGAEGAVLDPLTNDFLFSTFGGGNQIIRVSGFAPASVPEPTTLALGALGLAGSYFGAKKVRTRRKVKASAKK